MAELSPMMEQYFKIKNQYKNCLVFFRLGDFYEMFFEDAIIASRELNLVLTGRDCGQEERAPMCGVPYHSADAYIRRLVEKGYKIAICEQTEDPKKAQKLVRREVVRVVTPGTVTDPNALDSGRNNYIASVYEDRDGRGMAVCDITTGEFFARSFERGGVSRLMDELAACSPSEVITGGSFGDAEVSEALLGVVPQGYDPAAYNSDNAAACLKSHFPAKTLDASAVMEDDHAIRAAGALLSYLRETQRNSLAQISEIKSPGSGYMALNISTRRNLELTETLREKQKKGTLLWALDRTKTPMGARLLRKWIEKPLTDASAINTRLDMVDDFFGAPLLMEDLKELLASVKDMERLMSRIVCRVANGRDFLALRQSFSTLPAIRGSLGHFDSAMARYFYNELDTLSDLHTLIGNTISDNPPSSIKDGGMIRDGRDPELDRLRAVKAEGAQWVLNLEQREREDTGIKNLKIKYNKVFGYFIEITNSQLSRAPEGYIRRQTLSNCERFVTEELKKIEEDILGADAHILEIESAIFEGLNEATAREIRRVQSAADIVAAADALRSLAETAYINDYVRPEVNDGGAVRIKDGRHPVVERMTREAFIPNDVCLDTEGNRLLILTGPNMAGKSTYMRQVALIALMAQMGSFVPASSAEIGVCDRIFTRVGASDDLASGQSTFMVEMTEVADILARATSRSLIVLDEIGRGTSTLDGLSIAWSILEYIADKKRLGAKTLFATHYHELTELEGRISGAVNYRVSVEEAAGEVLFLRKIERGGARSSYGIHVAKLAGLPEIVTSRASGILARLNSADTAREIGEAGYTNDDEVVYFGERRLRMTDESSKIIIDEIDSVNDAAPVIEAGASRVSLRRFRAAVDGGDDGKREAGRL